MGWLKEHPVKSGVIALAGILLGLVAFAASNAITAFNAAATEDFDPAAALQALEQGDGQGTDDGTGVDPTLTAEALAMERQMAEQELLDGILLQRRANTTIPRRFELATAVSPELPDDMFNSVLLVGSDASGALADVIIDVLLPADGSAPIMVSIPRDLYLEDLCRGGYRKANSNLGGCRGVASGPELLALAVGRYTGVEVDHYARVSFSGFETIIDRMGGITVCVGDFPVHDDKSGLDLPAGCTQVGGDQALAWVRSRNPETFKDGEWVSNPGSDFDRQRKQQDVLFQLGQKLAAYSSVGALTGALGNLADAVKLDSGWGIGEIASIGIRYVGLSRDDIRRLSIPVENYRTSGGAAVLLPAETFNETLSQVYPAAKR